MEAAGVALAVLPLLLNQLDNYVQGLETLKGFRAKRYLRELEGYHTSLDTQQTIFINHLLRSLEGVVVYEDEIDDINNHALWNLWKKEALHSALKNKLGRNFEPFMQTMKEILDLLEDLSRKLGWDKNTPVEKYWSHTPSITREIKKFRDIFSKSIYSNLFTQINTANKALGTLLKQSEYQNMTQRRRNQKIPLSQQKKARRSARSLHNTIIHGKCWKCSCREQHSVYFVLRSPYVEDTNGPNQDFKDPKFRLLFASTPTISLTTVAGYEHEVEAQPDPVQSCTEYGVQGALQDRLDENIHRKVQFSIPKSTQDARSLPAPLQVSPISDMCVTLSVVTTSGEPYKLLGCLPDDIYRHNIYHVQRKTENLKSQSLAQVIETSCNPQASLTESFLFTQKHRLRLAVNFACSVLQFHGSWLKAQWRARDIMFTASISTDFDNPYVFWNVGGESNSWTVDKGKRKDSASLIRSEVLFPLGLVLVELSLCRTLESLRIPEDIDEIEAYTDLKTAARYLPVVEMQSGMEYGKVVERCLFWSGIKEPTLDNEQMQDEVFQLIILPLIDHLNTFEGKSCIS